ncbi:TetR family transcriptional regulator [Litorimonas taeanensis]|uniref:TetR family transcriptional regulator n=1 Tax=Litorimonas taeanensis TaxID=568099 RepID=A0A420WLT4_9PROT|nr:TetR/AcrR family transcriptional regulator [Litorimonas taeanensis]RKQ71882.1 TetR family transcriptional regulator [Litorimonas taeanensis]
MANPAVEPKAKKSRKILILDSAEALFAQYGYDGVTLRQITKRAGVDLALANYHFGPKRDLFNAVLERRADIVNSARFKALDECLQASKGAPSVEGIIDAYLRPLGEIQSSADDGLRHYLALIAYVNNSHEYGKEFMTQFFNPLVQRFIDALRQALPEADEQAIYWGYHYLSGALTLTFADTGRLDILSEGKASSSDFKTGYAHMIPFIAAGMRAICARGEPSN